MASYLVTGASRGLGLAMISHLANSPEADVGVVFAAARSQTSDLQSIIQKSSGKVVYLSVDTTRQLDVENAVKTVEKRVGDNGLDYLINNAGAGDFAPDWTETLTDLKEEFNVNVVGTHMVTTLFLPLLRKGQSKKIMNIASTMGSLALAKSFSGFPLPAYKVSKAALNALTIQWAQALSAEGFIVTSINPGTVKTAMGGGEGADLTLEQGATGILDAIVNSGSEKNGKFFMITVPGWENTSGLHRYDGRSMEW